MCMAYPLATNYSKVRKTIAPTYLMLRCYDQFRLEIAPDHCAFGSRGCLYLPLPLPARPRQPPQRPHGLQKSAISAYTYSLPCSKIWTTKRALLGFSYKTALFNFLSLDFEVFKLTHQKFLHLSAIFLKKVDFIWFLQKNNLSDTFQG